MSDVVVVGGGLAGVAAAVTLARGGRSVRLLESQAEPGWKIGETLAPEALQELRRLGLHDAVECSAHISSPGIRSAWGEPSLADKDFIMNPHGCGWQVDRVEFEKGLRRHAAGEGVDVRLGARFDHARRDGDAWELTVGAEAMCARWIIDATGRRSAVARALGTSREAIDQLVCVYALLEGPARIDRDARTYVEAHPDGWWYSALTPDGRRIVAYQTDADLIAADRGLEWFRAGVEQSTHISELLERYGYAVDRPPKLTSAHSGRLAGRHGAGWLAVGDAVQSFDPLSGQGMHHALFTGHLGAAELLKNGFEAGELPEYRLLLDHTWDRFLAHRSAFYGVEKRWAAREFWKRRLPASAGRSSIPEAWNKVV
jgi:flavin-dependent dehydrogenase